MWQALEAMKKVPTLIVRGARSDVLAPATAAKMVDVLDDAELVTVPDVGHTPTLDEPEAVAAIDRLLTRVKAELVTA
jgi:pimeloyl-ACP methyl ester carboxylesterase